MIVHPKRSCDPGHNPFLDVPIPDSENAREEIRSWMLEAAYDLTYYTQELQTAQRDNVPQHQKDRAAARVLVAGIMAYALEQAFDDEGRLRE